HAVHRRGQASTSPPFGKPQGIDERPKHNVARSVECALHDDDQLIPLDRKCAIGHAIAPPGALLPHSRTAGLEIDRPGTPECPLGSSAAVDSLPLRTTM